MLNATMQWSHFYVMLQKLCRMRFFIDCHFYNVFLFFLLFLDIEASRAAGLNLYDYGDIDELLMDPSYTTMDQKVMLSPLPPPPPPVSHAQSAQQQSSHLNGKYLFFNVENVKMHFFLLKSTWMRSCDLYTLSSLRHFIITAILLPAITFLMYFAFLIDETWLLHFLFDIICTRFLHQSFTSGLDSTTQTYILFSTPEEVLCCFVQY